MSVMPKRTITSQTPLSVKEIAEFANAIKVGDILYAMVPYRVWTSSTNYNVHYKPAKVTILNKYPHLVETDQGVLMWKELVTGYYSYSGPSDSVEYENVQKRKKNRQAKNAA